MISRVIGLHVVDRGHCARGIPKGGVRRHVVYPLAPDVDDAPVPKTLDMLFAGPEHGWGLLVSTAG
jgi:hypothetical protein